MRYDLQDKRINKDLEVAVIKAIAALANHTGGNLYIGVSDQGEILGLDDDLATFNDHPNREDAFRRHFDQLVTNNFGLANYQIVQPEWVKPEWAEPAGKKVFVVNVSPATAPMFVKGGTSGEDGDISLRRGASTIHLGTRRFLEYFALRWPASAETGPGRRHRQPGRALRTRSGQTRK